MIAQAATIHQAVWRSTVKERINVLNTPSVSMKVEDYRPNEKKFKR